MNYTLPPLGYKYEALEPYIDEHTMFIHHTKHHQSYINNINEAIKDIPQLNKLNIYDLIQSLDEAPSNKKIFIQNNAGGHINHSIFWIGLKKGTLPYGDLKLAIEKEFNSIENFKKIFEMQAMQHFGSGWVWLILKPCGTLSIISTINQDNPLMYKNTHPDIYGYPIIGLDIWEHAYYLKYENRRHEYINAFWSIINWHEANERFIQQI
uniref:Superoxide dismutase n=1 Tax=Candidatus Aschnera chinzeii TaxID=1485666 RepID=A0AAT9G5A1_9ENTR|nr:MAG: superoxide dismutase [Mn] [Candidatus Aschnera chinzeii]